MNTPSTPEDNSENDTRARLLRTALTVFGHHDFDAVSVRQIVQQADANIAAVSYHFGGKQGLYLATAEYLAEQLNTGLAPMLEHIRAAADTASPDQAAALLRELIGGLARNLLRSGFHDDATGFILREQHQPTDAFDVLYQRLMLPIQHTVQTLVQRLTGGQLESTADAVLVTHALLGQLLAFRMARTTVLRRLDQAEFSDTDIDRIATLIGGLTSNALSGALPRSTE